MRFLLLRTSVAALAVLAFAPVANADSLPAFRTPGDAAYCQMEFAHNLFDAFRCFTPNDGWWIRMTGLTGHDVQVAKGVDDRYRGYHPSGFSRLAFGKTWWSSDASLVTCWSRPSGLTCKHYDGLTFWIGRFRGYRIYVQPAGEKPLIAKPLFRTNSGVYCGLAVSMEPDAPSLTCWRASDGVELGVGHQRESRSSWSRSENARGYRPPHYPLLGPAHTFEWRCRSVDAEFATGCSTVSGVLVFSCRNALGRLTCRADTSHGFWVTRSSFYTF